MQEDNNILEIQEKQADAPAKHTVVGIRFRSCGKIYTFELEDIDATVGSKVVVESEMGLSMGNVVTPKYTLDKAAETLKKVLRVATEKDFETLKGNQSLEDEARAFCANRAKELNLSMKIIAAETTLDKKRFVFYFTADGRIDFRELVRDLAGKFKSRIEMRQIGVRDEVKLLGGIGICGRQTCCSLFLTNFEPVTIKMAKQQELSINQSKLSGICGRLMCCLGYECKEGKDAATVQDEELTTVTAEAFETNIQQAGSEMVSQRNQQKPVEGPSLNDRKKTEALPDTPLQQDSDKGLTERKYHGRRHHRHKKHISDSPVHTKPSQGGLAQKPVSGEQDKEKDDGKDKGKPFSRRRKFWKKKKP